MENHDTNRMLDLLADYFPRLGERINKSKALIQHVTEKLFQLDAWTVEHAMLRFATTHNVDPTWEQLLETVEQIESDAKRADNWDRGNDFEPVDAMRTAYDTAEPRMTTEADRAWAQMHVRFVVQGIASDRCAKQRLEAYEEFEQAYPELAFACQSQTRQLMRIYVDAPPF